MTLRSCVPASLRPCVRCVACAPAFMRTLHSMQHAAHHHYHILVPPAPIIIELETYPREGGVESLFLSQQQTMSPSGTLPPLLSLPLYSSLSCLCFLSFSYSLHSTRTSLMHQVSQSHSFSLYITSSQMYLS